MDVLGNFIILIPKEIIAHVARVRKYPAQVLVATILTFFSGGSSKGYRATSLTWVGRGPTLLDSLGL